MLLCNLVILFFGIHPRKMGWLRDKSGYQSVARHLHVSRILDKGIFACLSLFRLL